MTRYRDLLPLCEELVSFGIGFPELLAFHSAVLKKADTENLRMDTAAYRVVEEIEDYTMIIGMKNEISRLAMQKYAISQTVTPREKAISSLFRLQCYGITDEEIVNVHDFLNDAHLGGTRAIS
jgi:hypothetical protein